MEKDRRKFTREFPLNAVELSFGRENIKELANELDVRPELTLRNSASLLLRGFQGSLKTRITFRLFEHCPELNVS